MRRRSSGRKRGGRPARPAFRSARLPPRLSSAAQRPTDCRCTPTRRATSAWWTRPGVTDRPPPGDAALTSRNLAALLLDFPCPDHSIDPEMSLYYSIRNRSVPGSHSRRGTKIPRLFAFTDLACQEPDNPGRILTCCSHSFNRIQRALVRSGPHAILSKVQISAWVTTSDLLC